jgi:hypothetical protein
MSRENRKTNNPAGFKKKNSKKQVNSGSVAD